MKKKALKLHISGNLNTNLFKRVIKDNADKLNIRGFVRTLENGKIEVFAEGEPTDVDLMVEACNRGSSSSYTRKIEQKEENVQEFTDFKLFN